MGSLVDDTMKRLNLFLLWILSFSSLAQESNQAQIFIPQYVYAIDKPPYEYELPFRPDFLKEKQVQEIKMEEYRIKAQDSTWMNTYIWRFNSLGRLETYYLIFRDVGEAPDTTIVENTYDSLGRLYLQTYVSEILGYRYLSIKLMSYENDLLIKEQEREVILEGAEILEEGPIFTRKMYQYDSLNRLRQEVSLVEDQPVWVKYYFYRGASEQERDWMYKELLKENPAPCSIFLVRRNESAQNLKQHYYNGEGKTWMTTDYRYDDRGRIQEVIEKTVEGYLREKGYVYDDQGHLVRYSNREHPTPATGGEISYRADDLPSGIRTWLYGRSFDYQFRK